MKKIAIFLSPDKPEAVKWAEYTIKKIKEMGSECCVAPEIISLFNDRDNIDKIATIEEYDRYADLVISFGGDGTILSAARVLIGTDIPIMGVNVGRLGFLAEFSVKNIDESLKKIMDGEYRVVDRTLLETNINNETIYALNDFVIEKKDSSRMITVKTHINEHYIADYRADGLILTTPTGSTAYSLSCGGPILVPSTQVICLTPISPHSLTLRPLVIPDTAEVTLEVFSPTGEASFVADGQIKFTMKNGDKINCKKSESKIKLVKPLNSSYFDLIREKLLWAANPINLNIQQT